MPREICRVGTLHEEYRIKDVIARNRVTRSKAVVCATEYGEREYVHQDRAAVVLPVNWEERLVYLIEQPRHNAAFAWHLEAARQLDIALKFGAASMVAVTVPASAVHVLEAPAGVMEREDGGDPKRTAVRELEQECGYRVEEDALTLVSEHHVSVGRSTEIHSCYFANITARTPHARPLGDGGEHIITWEYTFKEAWELLNGGRVRCAALGILLREMFLRVATRPLEE